MILIVNNEGTVGVETAFKMLKNGNEALHSLISGIKIVEADTNIRTVGKGGWPNILGEVELDAAVMDGNSLKTGAVGGLVGYLHPSEVAYAVMSKLKHEILIGEGAGRFAKDIKAIPTNNLTENSKSTWLKHLNKVLSEKNRAQFPEILPLYKIESEAIDPEKMFDTTVYLGKDVNNKIATTVSTSGWAWKHPGRLGDSPIIGAGTYADSRYGACACTHTGEMAIRACTSRSVVLYMKMGMTVEEAVYEAAKDLKHLQGGFLAEVTIHAIDKDENYKVISYNGEEEVKYWLWTDKMLKPELKIAELINK